MLKVGFIGLGLMGNPMAKNILKKGFPLIVYNRTKEKTKELTKLGAKAAQSPADLATQTDVIITMVTTGKDVEEVLFGLQGVVKGAEKRLVIIDMSTIGRKAAIDIAEKLSAYGIEFLDAPVTGSTPKAITGELTIFVGGKESVLEKVRPVLSAMGTNIVYMGKTGSGQAIKLINNYFLSAEFIALSESMLLADGMNLPREKVAEALLQTPNLSPNVKLKLPNFVKNNFPLLFSLANMRKDLGLALLEMKTAKENLKGLVQTEKLFGKANKDKKLASEDFTAIMRQVEIETK